jgi:DNA-binding transcriptional LysR family regulator
VLDLRRLRYFVAVAEGLSFSRAAEELLIAQSAISRQVGLLERELGVRLLERSTHEVALTAAGESLLERGSVLLREADALWERTREFGTGARGRVAIGYSTSAGYETAPLLVGVLRERMPEVLVEAAVMPTTAVGEALSSSRIDLALTRNPTEAETLTCAIVRRERLGVLVPAGHRIGELAEVELGDLREESLVLHDRAANPAHFDLIIGACRGAGFEPRITPPTAPFDPGFGPVREGVALAVLGESAAASTPAGLAWIPLVAAPAIVVGLLARRGEEEPHVLRAHAEILAAAKRAGWIDGVLDSR